MTKLVLIIGNEKNRALKRKLTHWCKPKPHFPLSSILLHLFSSHILQYRNVQEVTVWRPTMMEKQGNYFLLYVKRIRDVFVIWLKHDTCCQHRSECGTTNWLQYPCNLIISKKIGLQCFPFINKFNHFRDYVLWRSQKV